jgi:predicted nucleic acid-binding protein
MKVFWDTNLFIYLLEDYGDLTRQTLALFDRLRDRGDTVVTSTLAIAEVMVAPRRTSLAAALQYRDRIRTVADFQPFDEPAMAAFAEIRLDPAIRAPDAIHLACSAASGAGLFVTNDDRLSRRIVPGVPILSSLASVPI